MEREYLGLSLSLSCSSSSNGGSPSHLTLLPPASSMQRQWCHLHAGIDVNRAPSTETTGLRSREEDGGGATSQRDAVERASDEEDDGDGGRKKLRLSKEQAAVLEESFKEHSTLNPKQKLALAKQLHLRPRQVEVWFQNRRARTKLKQTEVDCELLRRCCQELTEENTRLHKEVQELRALKLSPQLYMHMTPPTTLTLCPSCDRLSTSSKNPPHPEHHQFLRRNQQQPVVARWAPISLCPSFLDAPLQRS